jgi:predicted acyl esterase
MSRAAQGANLFLAGIRLPTSRSIKLGQICHTFGAGHRLEVDVTSSNFPRRARNTNSGHPILANDSEADIRVATNVIHHTAATPSFLELPVVG